MIAGKPNCQVLLDFSLVAFMGHSYLDADVDGPALGRRFLDIDLLLTLAALLVSAAGRPGGCSGGRLQTSRSTSDGPAALPMAREVGVAGVRVHRNLV